MHLIALLARIPMTLCRQAIIFGLSERLHFILPQIYLIKVLTYRPLPALHCVGFHIRTSLTISSSARQQCPANLILWWCLVLDNGSNIFNKLPWDASPQQQYLSFWRGSGIITRCLRGATKEKRRGRFSNFHMILPVSLTLNPGPCVRH